MEIIQQIAVKAVEEIFESVKVTGLSDIGKTIKTLTPVVSRTVLNVVTAFLEEMDEAAAEDSLLAEEVGLGLVAERGFNDAGLAAAVGAGIGESKVMSLAGNVLLDGDQLGNAGALDVGGANPVAGGLRSDHDDAKVGTGLNLAEVDVEAVGKRQGGL